MEFRNATEADRAAVTALYKSVIGTPFCAWDESYPGESDTDADLRDNGLFVLTENAAVIGALSLLKKGELLGFPEWNSPDADAAEICRIVVAQTHRGRGLARYMITEIEKQLRNGGKRYMRLSAHVGNTPALRNYGQLGFSVCGRRRLYGGEYFLLQKEL